MTEKTNLPIVWKPSKAFACVSVGNYMGGPHFLAKIETPDGHQQLMTKDVMYTILMDEHDERFDACLDAFDMMHS